MVMPVNPAAERLGPTPPVADWFVGLSHDSPFERDQDMSVWDDTAPRLATVPILIALLNDSDREVRVRILTALGTFGGQARQALPVLRAALKETALKDDDECVRTHAARALLRVGPEPDSEVAALADSLRNELEIVRFHAAMALGQLGRAARPAIPALIGAASWDRNLGVRVGAALALWKIDGKDPLVVSVLSEALAGDDELVCWMAADALAQIGPGARAAAPALGRALEREFKLSLVKAGLILALERVDPQTRDFHDDPI
jgi:HEAT repeat protein